MQTPHAAPRRLSPWLLVPLAIPFWTVVGWSNARGPCTRHGRVGTPPLAQVHRCAPVEWRRPRRAERVERYVMPPGDFPVSPERRMGRFRDAFHRYPDDPFHRSDDPVTGLRRW